jgi:hypothetical protein
MSPRTQRIAGALGTVAVSAIVNVATGFLTDRTALAWWTSGIVLLVVGVAVQWLLPTAEGGTSRRQTVSGATVRGSVAQTMHGPGTQAVSDSRITGDLTQNQDS